MEDESDLEPYPMEESDDEDSNRRFIARRSKGTKIRKPVYVISGMLEDSFFLAINWRLLSKHIRLMSTFTFYRYIRELIAYLKENEDPDKLEAGLRSAEELIRLKNGIGTEIGILLL